MAAVHKRVACKHYNNAPRGGARGEHVELIGKVAQDVKKSFKAFATRCELSGDKRYESPWNIKDDYNVKEIINLTLRYRHDGQKS